jgi:hypothetical protein
MRKITYRCKKGRQHATVSSFAALSQAGELPQGGMLVINDATGGAMKYYPARPYQLLRVWLAAAAFLVLWTAGTAQAMEISIDVAPRALNIQSDGQVVTIHTSLVHEDVDVATVYLNGIAIASWKEDSRGYFVAKFLMEDVKELPLVIDEYNKLTLVGITYDRETFWGEQEIMVINVIPAGQ